MSRIYVSYRRADDPFGAALVAAGLRDRFGEEGVFLDTWVLNRRGDPQAGLEEGLDASAVVLVFIGRRWEGLKARRRASGKRDWVAWEIREAADRGLPIVPVFLRRTDPVAEGVPAALRNLLPADGLCFVREGSLGRDVDALTARVAALDVGPSLRVPSGDAPVGDDLGPDTVRTGVDAMLRHVVPYAQQRMKNRDPVGAVRRAARPGRGRAAGGRGDARVPRGPRRPRRPRRAGQPGGGGEPAGRRGLSNVLLQRDEGFFTTSSAPSRAGTTAGRAWSSRTSRATRSSPS